MAHCGESTAGFYLTSLVAVDVATGWTELQAVGGKGRGRVGTAVHLARQALPMPLLSLPPTTAGSSPTTSSSRGVAASRSPSPAGRPYRKNDQAYVE